MKPNAIVLGGGMVGTCTALHLQSRGFDVVLIDRRGIGEETSHGNAGLIQQESVEPYPFPHELGFLIKTILRRSTQAHWHLKGITQNAAPLLRYFLNSFPAGHAKATQAYSRLIAHAVSEHSPLIAAAGADELITRQGFRFIYRTAQGFDEALARAIRLRNDFGVQSRFEDGAQLAAAEPALRIRLAGAVHWTQPWAVSNPGELTKRYGALFVARGGRVLTGDASSLKQQGGSWQVQTTEGLQHAAHAVVALGPWVDGFIRSMGYSYPMISKRGYHQHYAQNININQPMLDADNGYVLAPMARGIRLTTGAEFAPLDAPATPVQLRRLEPIARDLIGLGQALPEAPWLGARPCTADMLPVMGPAPRHAGLWFNFGHGHQGFTLGPMAGRMLAEMMAGETPFVEPSAYSPTRFE